MFLFSLSLRVQFLFGCCFNQSRHCMYILQLRFLLVYTQVYPWVCLRNGNGSSTSTSLRFKSPKVHLTDPQPAPVLCEQCINESRSMHDSKYVSSVLQCIFRKIRALPVVLSASLIDVQRTFTLHHTPALRRWYCWQYSVITPSSPSSRINCDVFQRARHHGNALCGSDTTSQYTRLTLPAEPGRSSITHTLRKYSIVRPLRAAVIHSRSWKQLYL